MAKLNRIQAEITYNQLWLGIVIVTGLSLVAALYDDAGAGDAFRIVIDLLALALIGMAGYRLHRKIAARIKRLEES